MLELPPLPMDAVSGREPLLRLRHAITNTNYYVEIYARTSPQDRELRKAIPAAAEALSWEPVRRLSALPLTGLARKVLKRMDLLSVTGPETPQRLKKRG
jgi:A/G-specific adenine glycosylase